MKPFPVICLLLLMIHSKAQLPFQEGGSTYTSMTAYSRNHRDVFSVAANPAALTGLPNSSAALFAEKKYLLRDLANYSLTVAVKTGSGHFGLTSIYAGTTLFRQSAFHFSYARQWLKTLDIGIEFDYTGVRIGSGYGNIQAISCRLGVIIPLTGKLQSGITVSNPLSFHTGKSGEKLPLAVAWGLGFDLSPLFYMALEIKKEEEQPLSINTGFHYQFLPGFFARIGITSSAPGLWMGAGWKKKNWRMDITASVHPVLGITPGLLLLVEMKNKKE
jgi:hypothetical protein